MNSLKHENYEAKLNAQVIHMDQAVCYNPEFRASRMLHDYPSRKMQLARALLKKQLEPSEEIATILFQSILSRNGERWQNFNESSHDYTELQFLIRNFLVKSGYGTNAVKQFRKQLKKHNGHLSPAGSPEQFWTELIPHNPGSHRAIFLDDATAHLTTESTVPLADYFGRNNLDFCNKAEPVYPGFEFFAYGLLEEGISHLSGIMKLFSDNNIREVWTLSAMTTYLLGPLARTLGIDVPFQVKYLLHEAKKWNIDNPSYIHAGSFNLRYLMNSNTINQHITNNYERPWHNATEFLPVYHADQRINTLNIWQKPISAEFWLTEFDTNIHHKITQDAIRDIRHTQPEQLIVLEPTAMQILKKEFPEIPVRYYFDFID